MKPNLTMQEWMEYVDGLEIDKEVDDNWFGMNRKRGR